MLRSFTKLVFALSLAACGRVGFERLDGAAVPRPDGAPIDGISMSSLALCERSWDDVAQLSSAEASLTLSLGISNGVAMAAYSQTAVSAFGAFVGERRAGASWDARRLDTANGAVVSPAMAVSPSGYAVAIWAQDDSSTTRYAWVARRSPSGAWSAPERMVAGTSDYAMAVSASIDSRGNALIAWTSGFMVTGWHVYASRATADGPWDPPQRIDTSTENSHTPMTHLDESGGALVVWLQLNELWWSRRTSADWSAAMSIGSARPIDSGMAGFADGRATVVWGEIVAAEVQELTAVSFDPSSGWTAPVSIDPDPNGLKQLAVAAREPDQLWLTWTQTFLSRSTTLFVRSRDAGAWSAPTPLVGPTTDGIQLPTIAAGPPGVLLGWQHFVTSSDAWTACYDDEAGWHAPVLMELAPENALSPEVALDANGNAASAWLQASPSGVMSVFGRLTLP